MFLFIYEYIDYLQFYNSIEPNQELSYNIYEASYMRLHKSIV